MKQFLIYLIIFLILFIPGSTYSQTRPGWTIETLKDHYDQRFDALQLAIIKAEQATEKRFEGVNEFRSTLADQSRTFMPRAESEAKFDALTNRVDVLSESVKKIENVKQGGNIVWAYLISAVSLIAAIISISINIQKKRT